MSGNLVPFPSHKPRYVLDSWPVVEWLKHSEPLATAFRDLVARASDGEVSLLTSVLNVGEIYYSSAEKWLGEEPEAVLRRMHELPIEYVPVSDEQVYAAARLKAVYGIAYADAFAASLAIAEGCPLMTGDPEFRTLEAAGILKLHWIGA